MSFRPSVASGEISRVMFQIHFSPYSRAKPWLLRERGAAGAKGKEGKEFAFLQTAPCKNNVTAPRSVRSPASTLRKICSKSLKHRTRVEGAGKGEFAFTECRNQFRNLAQNCSICAKEEPQAQKERKAKNLPSFKLRLAATTRRRYTLKRNSMTSPSFTT